MERVTRWLSDAWEGVTDFVAKGIGDAVGNGRRSEHDDVVRTQRHLGALGYLDGEPSGFVDRPLVRGLERFQRDHRLRADGWMRPGGSTEMALKEEGFKNLSSGWLLRRGRDDDDENRERLEASWGARLGGLGTALTGIAEVGAGMAGIAMPEPVTTAVGMAAVADGANRVGTGIAEAISGRDLDKTRSLGCGGAGYTAKVMKYGRARISDGLPGIGIRVDRHGKRVFNADLHRFSLENGIPKLGVRPKQEVLLPHYHRLDTFPSGKTKPGGGIGRHRPYEEW